MYGGCCHCGAVRWTVSTLPAGGVRCNCSICRRLGAVWGYTTRAAVTLDVQLPVDSPLIRYRWGDGLIGFCSCSRCGATTHYESVDSGPDARFALNLAALEDAAAYAAIPVRHFDGAESWAFLD